MVADCSLLLTQFGADEAGCGFVLWHSRCGDGRRNKTYLHAYTYYVYRHTHNARHEQRVWFSKREMVLWMQITHYARHNSSHIIIQHNHKPVAACAVVKENEGGEIKTTGFENDTSQRRCQSATRPWSPMTAMKGAGKGVECEYH